MDELTTLSKSVLQELYVEKGKSDKEIGMMFNLSRNYISEFRKRFSINSRFNSNTGRNAELLSIRKLTKFGYKVKDMNLESKLSDYDILLNNQMRIDVKSSKLFGKEYKFSLTDSVDRRGQTSNNRILINSNRTKKLYHKTCDLLIFVGIGVDSVLYLLIPPSDLPIDLQVLSVGENPTPRSKYFKYLDNWKVINELLTDSGGR